MGLVQVEALALSSGHGDGLGDGQVDGDRFDAVYGRGGFGDAGYNKRAYIYLGTVTLAALTIRLST
ncbi:MULTISPECIES: hypothetical protein [unclassified Streptomyces]|uniref:hypothetical protein n=1 Tax=unclassified Streptomyces TaxID=2593676 RepID=UPI003247533A